MSTELAAAEVTKTIKLPVELWEEIEAEVVRQDTDFSKFCRNALRQHLERMTDRPSYNKNKR